MKRIRGDRVTLTPQGRRNISKAITIRNKTTPSPLKDKKRPNFSGNNHPLWKGGRFIQAGYYWLSNNGTTIAEHRHIMELHLKRELESHEIVHHKNHNKLDNRITNLIILTRAEHARLHKLEDESS
jgi:hypothetical protein